MFCEAYKRELTEAAALGDALPAGAARHFRACAACKAAWLEERELFAAIDSSLRNAVNVAAPASLAAGLRQQIALQAQAAAPRAWKALAAWSAVAAVAVLCAAIGWRPKHELPARVNGPAAAESSPREAPDVAVTRETVAPPARASAVAVAAKKSQRKLDRDPEVLVSADEARGFALYLNLLKARNEAEKAEMDLRKREQLEIEKLAIAELEFRPVDIRPLDDAKYE